MTSVRRIALDAFSCGLKGYIHGLLTANLIVVKDLCKRGKYFLILR